MFHFLTDFIFNSRLSGGSAQSDVLPEKKKKKGLFGKLKKLTKSRSIDDQVEDDGFRPIGTVSQVSIKLSCEDKDTLARPYCH